MNIREMNRWIQKRITFKESVQVYEYDPKKPVNRKCKKKRKKLK